MGGEPNNAIGGTEHCLEMRSSKRKNEWNDIPCSKSYDNLLLMCSYNLRTGGAGDVSYCTLSGPCTFGQGDCDKDTDCSGSLVCGKDNCRDFNSKAHSSYDCCTNGPTTTTTTSTSTTTTVVDGGWSSWSYGACNKTCGGGTQRGTRSCNNPRPSNGGKICVGSGVTTRQCNTKSCPGGCRTGWMEFAGRCYYVAKGTKNITWDASEAECKKLDTRSYLPSVGSQLEQDYIAQYAKDANIYLRATDKDKEGQWKWTDGRPWTYTKWAPGEPNNAIGGTEHCLEMRSSKLKNEWNDVPCSKSYDNLLLMCSYNLRTGGAGDVSYCTLSGPCTFGQGDCDKDTECSGSLVCGKDNCKDFNSKAHSSYDCCTNGPTTPTTTTPSTTTTTTTTST